MTEMELLSLYLHLGWPLFPLKGKRPLTLHGFKDATLDMDKIIAWDKEIPGCGWGVDCGRAGIFIADIDLKNGGEKEFEKIWKEAGSPSLNTPTVATGGGGHHYYFALNGEKIRSTKLANGIDIKSIGGYVVLPPSIHPNGNSYRWINPPDEYELEPIPDWILEKITNKNKSLIVTPKVVGIIQTGVRNNTLTSLAGGMRRRGMSQTAITAALKVENVQRCDPPLPTEEVVQIAASISRYEPEQPTDLIPEPPQFIKSSDFISALAGLGWSFQFNEMTSGLEVNGVPITDPIRATIRSQLRDYGYKPLAAAEDSYIAHALENSYHPIRDWLLGLEWDGIDYIDRLAEFFKDRYDVFPIWLRRWLVGAVARVLHAGSQNRVLILDSAQGLGKSYFVRWLASPMSEYFIEGPIIPDSKDCLLRLVSSWIWEIAELGATTRKADREALKFFLSQETVTVRRPYGRYDEKKPAVANFIGTVNNEAGFLADPTGSRRFMATTLESIDWSYLSELNPISVWANAVWLFKSGEPWELQPEETVRANEINLRYQVEDPIQDYLERMFDINPKDSSSFTHTSEILDRLQAANIRAGTTRALQMSVAGILRQKGIESTRRVIDGRQIRGYAGVRPH